MTGRSRGQLVLLAAAALAVALVPVVVAYLQLGYHADVRASRGYDAPARNAERVLARSVHGAALDAGADASRSDRNGTVDAFRAALGPRLDALETARVEAGTAYRVAYNASAASAWAASRCPGGPDRQFGPCVADRGVVVQDRAGETHVLAAAFDVRVTTRRGTTRTTVVVRVVGGPAR